MNNLYKVFFLLTAIVCLPILAFAQPPNDACSGAYTAPIDGTCIGPGLPETTTTGAGDSWAGSVGCAGNNDDVWFTFVATESQLNVDITAGTLGGDIEFVLVEASGACTGLGLAGSLCGASPLSGSINGLQAGTTYYVTISGTGSNGTFTMCLENTAVAPSPGQDCSTAAILCDASTFSQGTSSAGFGNQEISSANSCWGSGGERQSKWFKFTIGCDGTLEFNINPVTSGDDYDWSLYDISSDPTNCPSLTSTNNIACNWSGCKGSTGVSSCTDLTLEPGSNKSGAGCGGSYAAWSTTVINVTAGETYALLVDNFSTSNSGFSLTFGGACGGGTAVIGPDADFTYTSPSCGAFDFTKTCQTTNSTFFWNFGDGSTSTAQNPSHTYVSSGTYTISLTVTDALGCSSTTSQTVTVGIPPAPAVTGSGIYCEGDAINLTATASSGGTLNWYDDITLTNQVNTGTTYSPSLSSGSYTFYVTETVSGCTSPASSIAVVVTAAPTATASNNGPLCEGEQLDLTGGDNGMISYSWTGPNTYTSNTQSPTVSTSATTAMAGIYTLTVDNGTCTNTATTTVVVNALPVATAANNGPLCEGDQLDLTGGDNGMTSYAWTGPNTYTSNTQSPTVSTSVTTAMAGTYTLTVDDGTCTNTASTTVTVNALPTATAANNGPLCEGEQLDLTGGDNGMTSYAWTGPNTYTSNTQSPTVSTSATTAMVGTYTLTVNDGNCTNTATTTVVVNALPTATAVNNGPLCEGEQLDLTGGDNGMTSYVWSGPSAYTSSSQSPTVSTSATTAMAGTYTLTVDDGTCTNTASTTVVVNALPTATAANNGPLCEGEQLDLTGGDNGMISYAWTGPGSYTNNSQSPTVSTSVTTAMAGTYTLTVDDGTCTNTASTTVTVNALPTATASNNGPLCEGTQLDLTGGDNGMTSYAWSGPNTYTSNIQSPTVSTSATTAMAGTYTLTVDNGTCTNTASTTVVVNALPTATAANNGPLCEGEQLDLTGGDNGMTSYAWTGPNTYTSNTQSPTVSTSATTAMAGTYTLTVDDGTCTNTATTTVVVNALPVATAANNGPLCEGEQLDLTGGDNGMTSYAWTGPNAYASSSQSPTVSASATTTMAGTYTLTVDDGTCTNTATTTVVVNALPVATAANNGPLCEGEQLDLTGGDNGMTSYSWTGPNSYSSNTQSPTASTSVTTAMAGTYTLTVDNGTCTNTASTTVIVNALPTATASNNGPLCEGEQLDLTGGDNGMTSYSWTGPNSYTSSSQSPTVSTSVTTAMAGTYTLTVDNGTCTNTASTTVVVNAPPVVDISGISINDPSACGATDGSITGITATGSAPLSYVWNGGSSQASADISGIGAGSYSLVVTDGNGCSSSEGPFSLSDPSSPPAPTLSLAAGPICNGGSFTIDIVSPDGTATYTWSGPNGYSNTGTSITVSGITNSESGNYTAYATIGGCVGASATPISVTVNSLPIVDILPPATSTCSDPIVTLDGSNSEQGASISYAWTASSGGVLIGTGSNDVDSTSTAGDYQLLVTNTTTGCADSSTVSVTVNGATPTSVATASNSGIIDCAVTSVTLDGSGSTNNAGGSTGITYSWATSPGGASFDTNPTTTVTSAGTYYLLITETLSGCTDETSVVVTDNTTTPIASISGAGTLDCITTTVNLDGSGSTGSSLSYEWQDGSSNSVGTNSSLTVNAPDTYTLIITNTTNSCTDNTSVTITQDISTPIASTVSPQVVDCNNPVVLLDGSASDQGVNITYAWSNPGTGVILGSGMASTDSTSTADTYTLTVTNTTNGCNSSADVIVTMDTVSPIADAGTDVNFPCGVTSVSLDGSASSGTAISYNWTGPGTISGGTTATPDVDATGTYSLTVTASNGCTDTDDVDVIPNSNAPVADAGSDITVTCSDLPWNVTLDGSGSDSGANISYNWTVVSGSGSITNGTTTTPGVDQEGTYQITVTNTTNSCFSTATVNVVADTISPVANAGIDASFTCNSGATIDLDGSNSSGSNITFNWTTTNGTIDAQTGSTATVSSDGDYTLTVTADNGCTDSDDVTVTMDTITPVISIATPDSLDCLGSSVTLDASSTTGNNETYSWSNGGTSSTTDVTTAGTYTLTVTNDNGCSSSSSVTVENATGPIASFTATPDSGNVPLDVTFTDASTGNGLSYNWDLGDGTSSTTQNPSNTYSTLGDFEVILIITDNNGCTDSDTLIITTDGETELIIPNIFTPNSDGDNDLFILGQGYVLTAKGVIFNRWGEPIYNWNGLNTGWDGRTTTGLEVPEGVYYYIYEYEAIDGSTGELTGFIQLIR